MREAEKVVTNQSALRAIGMGNSMIKKGEIYHLVAERGNHTLCGLRISMFSIPTKKVGGEKGAAQEEGGSLCKHCERIDKQEES